MRIGGAHGSCQAPHRYANQLPEQVEAAIVAAKREKPNWGARKIRERLLRRLPSEVKVPGSQHHSRHPGSSWTGDPRQAIAHRTEGTPLSEGLPERPVVHRL
jgi:hypothetical protein